MQLNNSIIYIKNISKETFQHPFGGVPYSINAGETLPFIYPVGMLLAKHLAMKLARDKAKSAGKLEGNDDRKSVSLYAANALEPIMSQIIVKTVDQALPAEKTEAQLMKERTERIQSEHRDSAPAPKAPEVDKKDVMAELKKMGIKFNPRDSKDKLLLQLTEAQASYDPSNNGK